MALGVASEPAVLVSFLRVPTLPHCSVPTPATFPRPCLSDAIRHHLLDVHAYDVPYALG